LSDNIAILADNSKGDPIAREPACISHPPSEPKNRAKGMLVPRININGYIDLPEFGFLAI
jgi:hypothetical protein